MSLNITTVYKGLFWNVLNKLPNSANVPTQQHIVNIFIRTESFKLVVSI